MRELNHVTLSRTREQLKLQSGHRRIGRLSGYTKINTERSSFWSQIDCPWKVKKVGTGTIIFHHKAFRSFNCVHIILINRKFTTQLFTTT